VRRGPVTLAGPTSAPVPSRSRLVLTDWSCWQARDHLSSTHLQAHGVMAAAVAPSRDESSTSGPKPPKALSPAPKKTMLHHLFAGGAAGFVESSVW
jgi:hypothetical protein